MGSRPIGALGALVALVLAAAGCGSDPAPAATPPPPAREAPPAPKTVEVKIRGMVFAPAEVVVAPGDTVTWVNEDIVPHTATADPTGGAAAFDSGDLQPKARWSWTAGAAGTWAYTCRYHPTMKGTVVVR